ncbi:Myb/SANT-like domain, partial [Dillenia turbinata]
VMMGSQSLTSNERTRTYWTSAMERYFIDLMLDQMNRGNRLGHTFNKQAWTDMLTMFNAKFESQYDKDVLKSRYTNLWKQFNDIKNLLNQAGFTWDESRQMVIADDYVWDAYIKVHPDARSYKMKAILNFSDLCLIYGYTTADGRYSRSSHDVDFEDEIQGINTGDGNSATPAPNNERSRTEWTPAMDQYFIELLLDQLERGNRVDSTFSKQSWNDMLNLFNAKFGPQHGKRVLRHRYKKLWKYYCDITILLKQDGFYWDETQQMVAAEDDVWDGYIKAHSSARQYRTKALPNYKHLALIFGDAITDGVQSDLQGEIDLEDDALGTNAGDRERRTISLLTAKGQGHTGHRQWIVHRGNKIGQTFISQAWSDMVTSFNAKFGSHHDKDVLKNRYKHMKRQYHDIKVLLGKDGFSWDDTREMVIAEDHVWDSHIKAHPDARSYRVKTVSCYHKLCIIYGQESSDGRYSRLAHNADTNCETAVLLTGDRRNEQSAAPMDPGKFEWTQPMDRSFIDLMLEQVHEGNKIDGTFGQQSWAYIVASFSEKFGLQCDKCVLENRYFCFLKEYQDIQNLLSHSGFKWDETQNTISAEDDVWEAYTKEHPDAISYRGKSLGNYNDLCMIFGDGNSDEGFGCFGLDIETDHHVLGMDIDGVPEYIESPIKDLEMLEQNRKRFAGTPSASERSGKVLKTDKVGSFVEMANGVSTLVGKEVPKNYVLMENAIDALQSIPDMDDELLLDACDLLEDEMKAKTFLALDAALRKKWLLRKLCQ